MPAPIVFDVPFQTLELNHVLAFLASVSGEGLIWEAKGTDPLKAQRPAILKEVSGFANQLGGVLILGASERPQGSGNWELDGIENDLERENPRDWIARIVAGNLRETPPFDVRHWTLDNGKIAAAIRVEQAAAPPCMTRSGKVYQRLPTGTSEVKEPRVLAELVERGRRGYRTAEHLARRAARRALMEGRAHAPDRLRLSRFVVALASVGAISDIASRLFTPGYRDVLIQAAREFLRPDSYHQRLGRVAQNISRDGRVVRLGAAEGDSWEWSLAATWDGTVTASLTTRTLSEDIPNLRDVLPQAWNAVVQPLAELTGIREASYLPAHLVIETAGRNLRIVYQDSNPEVATADRPIQRWTKIAPPTEDELASVERELARSGGAQIDEPQ